MKSMFTTLFRYTKILCILALSLFFFSCRNDTANNKSFPINDSWKIKEGSSLSWAAPDFDSENWQTADLTKIQVFNKKNSYVCARGTFEIPSQLQNQNVYLGFKKFNAACNVYADGVYIGSRGRFPPVEDVRLEAENDILIPASCIHDGKVQLTIFFYKPEVELKSPGLAFENEAQAFFINNVKVVFNQHLFIMMAVASIFFIFYSLLQYFIDSRDISYIFFVISVAFVAFYFYDLGSKTLTFNLNLQRPLFRTFLVAGMSFLILFLNRFYNRKHYKGMLITFTAIPVLFLILFLTNNGKSVAIDNLFLASLTVVIAGIVYGFICTIHEIKQGNKDSIPILVGFILGTLIALHDIIYQAIGVMPFMWIQGIAFFALDFSIFITLAIRQLKAKHKAEILAIETERQKETLSNIITNAQSLANDSNQIALELNESVNSVIRASEQTQAKINDINIAIQEQNRIREETDVAVHNLTDFLNNMSNEVDTETEIITKTVKQTQDVIDGITKVGEGISTAASFTSSLSKLTKAGSDDTKKLLEISEEIQSSTKEILGVVTTLDAFAGQIDLLSMNASIEAAHSGAAGKGFSVIAHEIKNLASQVQQWSARIGEIITNVTNSIGESVILTKKVNNALTEINEGSIQSAEKVNSASDGIKIQEEAGNAISQDSKTLYKSANQMQAEVKNQSSFSGQVLGNMESLSNASNSVNTASDQIAQESERLSIEAQKLSNMAKRTTEAAEKLLKLMQQFFTMMW